MTQLPKLDNKDLRILEELSNNSKLTTNKLSKKLNLPITTIHNRIKKLEKTKVIEGYTLKLNHKKLNKAISAYILTTLNYTLPTGTKISQDELAKKIKRFEEVEEVNITAGVTDLLIKVRVSTVEALNDFVIKRLRSIDGIDKTQTMICMKQV